MSPKSAPSRRKSTSAPIKYYLVAFNTISALGWAYVLILIIIHVFNLDGKTPISATSSTTTASSILSRYLSLLKPSASITSTSTVKPRIQSYFQLLYSNSTSTFIRIGTTTAFVQSLALLEVAHVLLGWVRSPLQTTVMQVSSRLILVWAIVEQFNIVHTNPLYTSMVFAWSATEVIRYSFYACNLLGIEPYFLLFLRYTTFYVLYPLGASSEAFIIYATLPSFWFRGLWKPTDYVRALLFFIWWPGLYIMYTYMIAQRRKVLGTGPSHRSDKSKGSKVN